MTISRLLSALALSAAMAAVLAVPDSQAQSVADFYQGKAVETPAGKPVADKRRAPATAAE